MATNQFQAIPEILVTQKLEICIVGREVTNSHLPYFRTDQALGAQTLVWFQLSACIFKQDRW